MKLRVQMGGNIDNKAAKVGSVCFHSINNVLNPAGAFGRVGEGEIQMVKCQRSCFQDAPDHRPHLPLTSQSEGRF